MTINEKVAETRKVVENQWPTPNSVQSILFAISELGEVADAIVHSQREFTRSDQGKTRNLAQELAQTRIMIATAGNSLEEEIATGKRVIVDAKLSDNLMLLSTSLMRLADLTSSCVGDPKKLVNKLGHADKTLEYFQNSNGFSPDDSVDEELLRITIKYGPK